MDRDSTEVAVRPLSYRPFESVPLSHTDSSSAASGAPLNTALAADLNGAPDEEKGLRPFLSLAPRLWLTAFNPALLPLIFTIFHIAATRDSTAELAANLKDSVFKACQGVAKGASALQTLPRYLAMQTNEQALKATRATVLGTGLALMFCVQAINAVVNFIVDTYRSLLLCTIQLVVQGTLEVLIGAVKEITDFIEGTLNRIRLGLQDDIAAANSVIQKAVGGVASVLKRIGVDLNIPDIDIPKLSWLNEVKIPTGFEDALVKLNSTIPNLDELRKKMNEIVDIPFDLLVKQINETRHEIAATLNDSIYPVPSLKSLAGENTKSLEQELCADLNTDFIDDTANALYKLGTIAIWVMVIVVLLAWGALAFWQWRRWCALKDTVEVVENDWSSHPTRRPDVWTAVAVIEHPVLERYSRPVFDKFNLQPKTRNNVRWFLSYLAHPTCLTLLFMSVVGLIAIQCQLLALHALQDKAERDAVQGINASTSEFAARLNAVSANASREYATEMNQVLTSLERRINEEMFGEWINTTAITLNNTLVEFYGEVQKALDTAFGGTILYNPINTFMYCILGSKIDSLEQGLTWVSEHAHVTLPLVDPDVLLLSSNSSKELAAPLASAAVGDTGDGGAVGKLVAHFEKALNAELLIYGILLAVYGVIFAVGFAVVIWNSGGKRKYTAWRASRQNNNAGPDDFPNTGSRWRWSSTPLHERYTHKEKDLPHADAEKGPEGPVVYIEPPHESLSRLAAPGQAFLRIGGWNASRNPSPSPDAREVPLPPLPPGTPDRPSSVISDKSRSPTPGASPRRIPITQFLLPAIERRKRAFENHVEPYPATEDARAAENPFEDNDPFPDPARPFADDSPFKDEERVVPHFPKPPVREASLDEAGTGPAGPAHNPFRQQ